MFLCLGLAFPFPLRRSRACFTLPLAFAMVALEEQIKASERRVSDHKYALKLEQAFLRSLERRRDQVLRQRVPSSSSSSSSDKRDRSRSPSLPVEDQVVAQVAQNVVQVVGPVGAVAQVAEQEAEVGGGVMAGAQVGRARRAGRPSQEITTCRACVRLAEGCPVPGNHHWNKYHVDKM